MKKLLLLLIVALFSNYAFSQIGLVDEDGNNVENTVFDVYASSDEFHLEHDFKIQNLSTLSHTYNLKRYELEYIEGSQEYYCWTLCLSPVNAGTDYLSVFPGDTYTLGAGLDGQYSTPAFHFKPQGFVGTATYRYVVYDVDNVNDSIYIDMVYHIGTVGVNEYENDALSSVYPNPANNEINITMNTAIEDARFEIYSMVGTKVVNNQFAISGGKVSIDVSDLPNGVYMLTETQSQITRRFIISR